MLVDIVKSEYPDLSLRQMATMMIVYQNTGDIYKTSDIATQLLISGAAQCRILDRLESHGFIKRQLSALDRRKVYILPTSTGHIFIDFILARFGHAAALAQADAD